jgi:hypothetical protein
MNKISNKDYKRLNPSSQIKRYINLYQEEIDPNFPFLQNLNEDPLLNGKIKYSLKNGELTVGRKHGKP